MIGKKGLFGKRPEFMTPGIGDGLPGAMPEMRNVPTTAGGMFGNPMPSPSEGASRPGLGTRLLGQGWEGKAAALGASLMGDRNAVPQYFQMQDAMAFRQAEEQRRRAENLADFRTQMQIRSEFETPDAPKPGSFEWYQNATPEQRAEYDRYNPVTVSTWQGPTIIPRSSLGGTPSRPVGKLTPIQPTIENTPAPQLGANGMPAMLTRQQYQAVVERMGAAETEAWARRNNVRVAN